MKRIAYILIVIMTITSCDKVDELTKFDVDYESNYTIASTTIINTPFSIITPDITTNSTSTFENNNTRSDLVESIRLRSVRITLISPSDSNFDFLRSMRVFLDADDLEEVEVAFITDLEDDNVASLNLQLTNQELKEFIKKESFRLRVQTTTDQTLTQDHDIKIDCKFRVDAKILGV